MAPVLIGRGAKHMANFSSTSLTIQNADEELDLQVYIFVVDRI